MALHKNITNTCTCPLLLLILLFSQLSASQGRPLLPDGSIVSAMQRRYLLSHGNEAVSPSSTEIHGDNAPMADVDDVRPTNPGHSPGIGHAFVNKNYDGVVDDVRPTNPGHSPGIGHSFVNKSDDDGVVDDVRPTNPGHSPGIGHAFVNKNDDNDVVDGVRPTNPGHSPGIGHAIINKNGQGKKL
uniref:Uncharacterized protein n=1 Tax=Leersia perrieri TaxID=77586 RepID=A0A0D9VUV1_9ORYZ